MEIAKAYVRIEADTTRYKRDMAEVEQVGKKTADNVGSAMARLFSAAAFGAGIKKSIDAASDLNETVSKSHVIFGDAADDLEKIAATADKSMGLSKRAYLDGASGLKGLLDNLGLASDQSVDWSKKMTALGSDLGSFFNKAPADAIAAIGSALRGESEPIRQFNVNINEAAIKTKAFEMGLYDGTGAIDTNAKAQATLALIMDQTTAAQGDFARTADGAANSSRIAAAQAENGAASFGQVLLPVYTRVVQVLGFLAEGFGSLPSAVQVAFVALAGFAMLGGPVGNMVGTIKAVTGAISDLGTTTKVSLGVVGLLIGIAGTLYSVFSDGDDKTTDLTAGTKNLVDALKQSTSQLLTNLDAVRLVKGELPDTTAGFTALSTAVVAALNTENAGSGDQLVKMLGEMGLTAQDAASAMAAVTIRTRDSNGRVGDLAAAVKGLTIEQVNWASKTRAATYEQELANTGFTEAEAVSRGYTRAVFDQREELRKITAGTNGLATAMKDSKVDVEAMAKGFLDQARGASDLTKGLVEQAEAQAASTGNAGDAVTTYLDYIAATTSLSDEQKKLALDLDAAAAANAQLAPKVEENTDAAKDNKEATDEMGKALDRTTTIFDEVAAAADKMRKAIDAVFGSSMDMEEANRALYETAAKQKAAFEENGVSLDILTEAGRKNRAAVEDQVNAILDYGVAMVGAGKSNDEAAQAVMFLADQLRQQMLAAGFTEDQVNEYLNTLGLTPDNVTTTIDLANDEATKERIDALIKDLGVIDAGAAAEIQADIDAGKFAEAEAKLKELQRERDMKLRVSVTGGGSIEIRPSGGSYQIHTMARGGKVKARPGGIFANIAEAGEDEAVLPLGPGSRSRLSELLSDPDIGGPVADALGGTGPTAPAGSTSTSTTGRAGPAMHIEHVHLASELDAEVLGRTASYLLAGSGVR